LFRSAGGLAQKANVLQAKQNKDAGISFAFFKRGSAEVYVSVATFEEEVKANAK